MYFNNERKFRNQLRSKCQGCEYCFQKKIYKCMQSTCESQKLICPQCDVFSLQGNHFDHKFTYALPLFTESRPKTILTLHEQMQNNITQIKKFLQQCIIQLQKALEENKKYEEKFSQILQQNNLAKFLNEINNIDAIDSLDNILSGVRFLTEQECRDYLKKATTLNRQSFQSCEEELQSDTKDTIRTTIIEKIENMIQEQVQLTNPFFFLNKGTIKINEQHWRFRDFKELYSDNWAYTSVQITLGDKSNVEINLIPFQQCRKLEIIQSAKSKLIEQQPNIQNWIAFPNIVQMTIYGEVQLLERVKPYWSKAKILNIHSSVLWDAKLLGPVYSMEMEEVNLFFKRQSQKKSPFLASEVFVKIQMQTDLNHV